MMGKARHFARGSAIILAVGLVVLLAMVGSVFVLVTYMDRRDAAAGPEVRRTLRNRARYEVANNSYARGIVLTLANDVIGTGPRLQMLLGDPSTSSGPSGAGRTGR